MDQKQRFFIYDRKEMGVLFLLGVMVAIFAFTLGVHLGKRVGPKNEATAHHETAPAAAPVSTLEDSTPNRQELNEQAKGAQQAVDDSLNQAIHEEVSRTGIKLDTSRQVQLPKDARSGAGGATTSAGSDSEDQPHASHAPSAPSAKHSEPQIEEGAALHRPAPEGKFTLQIGSYPALDEAKDQAAPLEALGLKPFVRPAEVKGKIWFRVYVGGYKTRDAAEKAGSRYVTQNRIEAFVVSKMVE